LANLTKLILVLVAIHIIFQMTGVVDLPGTSVYQLLTNPTNWGASDIISLLNDLTIAAGGTLVIVGTLLPGKHDLMVFAGLATVMLTFGIGFGELFILIQADAEAIFAGGGKWIATLFVSPIVAIYFMTVISFWRGRSD